MAQKLTVLSGGSLIQHVNNHGSSHKIYSSQFDKLITVTSTHHQMMYPFKLNKDSYVILGHSDKVLSDVHEICSSRFVDKNVMNINYDVNFCEPEIVYYRNTNALCIQGHPEYISASKDFVEITKELLLRQLYNML